MCQVVAYRMLKAIENSKTVGRKSDRGRLRGVVVYERFQYKALTEDIFSVLGRWSLNLRLREVVERGGYCLRKSEHPFKLLLLFSLYFSLFTENLQRRKWA